MLSSLVRSFTDADDYGASIRGTTAELTVTTRGQFAAKLTQIDLHNLWMQRFSENLPRIVHSSTGKQRSGIAFRTRPGPPLYWNLMEMEPPSIVQFGDDHDAFASFGTMSLPRDTWNSVAEAIAGCDLAPPRDELNATPKPAAMARLLRLHAAAEHLAENTPEIIAHPARRRAGRTRRSKGATLGTSGHPTKSRA
jgi:hypothetical protein